MFLPCDLRDWMPAGHLVHFILEAVEQLLLTHFHLNPRGTGSEQYPPGHDAGAAHLRLRHRPLWLPLHRDGDRQRRGRALPLRLTQVGTVSVDGAKIQAHARRAQRDAGKKPARERSHSAQPGPRSASASNFTDARSRIMKAGRRQHFAQADNAQAAVGGALLIVGQRVSDAPNDRQELGASVAAPEVPVVLVVLLDSGFYSAAAVQAVEQKPDGKPSGRTVSAAVEKHSQHPTVADPQASAKKIMAHRLQTAAGQALYKLRQQTVDPVFGIIKEVMGSGGSGYEDWRRSGWNGRWSA